MTKTEQARVTAWRLKILRWSQDEPRYVARTCRHFGISRTAFYRWKRRFEAYGEAGLGDRPRTPHRSPRATPREVVSKILYLRQQYHFGPGRIADYLKRFHQASIARSSVHRILGKHGLSRLPANHATGPPFRIQVIQTDNGAEFQSQFHWHAEALDIRHVYIRHIFSLAEIEHL